MKLLETLEKTLKKEPNFITDNGELKKWVIINKAQNYDEELIELLLSEKELKEKFFKKIKDVTVFNQALFIQFLEQKNYLNDSYTQYKNKVGLTIDGKYLKQRNEVALVWPFKDCILEGGQSTEEQKRDEIFFNEILAQDEITQLLEPKVLTDSKRYNADGERKLDSFKRNEKGIITDNLIIKGNNLLALHSLKREFEGKVKLIYIDPPYYFKDTKPEDTFLYNSNFKLSSWLTFMKNRLDVAKHLLSNDGVIFIQIKDDGIAPLKILMDEVFEGGFINLISVKMSEATGVKMSHAKTRFPNIKEFILFYKKGNKFNGFYKIDKYESNEWDKENNIFLENISKEQRQELLNIQEKEEISEKDVIYVNKILSNVKKVPLSKKIKELSSDVDELEWLFDNSYRIIKTAGSSSLAKQILKINKIPDQDIAAFTSAEGILFFYITDFNRNTRDPRLRVIFADENIFKNPCDFWQDIKTSGAISLERGVQLNGGKKPEKLLKRIIDMTTKEGDIVLDYHSGSGTTAGVAHKMKRQWITIEQIDNQIDLSLDGLNNVIRGDKTGISENNDVNWQGGGSFVYFELKKYNETFIEQIEKAKDTTALLKIWEDMKKRSFLNYNVDIKKQDEHIEDFKQLTLKQQKEHLCELLDKNQLYVNLSSMDDKDFACTDEEKRVTKDFYGIKE